MAIIETRKAERQIEARPRRHTCSRVSANYYIEFVVASYELSVPFRFCRQEENHPVAVVLYQRLRLRVVQGKEITSTRLSSASPSSMCTAACRWSWPTMHSPSNSRSIVSSSPRRSSSRCSRCPDDSQGKAQADGHGGRSHSAHVFLRRYQCRSRRS